MTAKVGRYLASIAAVLLVCGCSEDPPRDRKSDVDDIYEAVFRHQFKKNHSSLKAKAEAYCLAINDKDPPAEFLKRFEGHEPQIRPKSEFKVRESLVFNVHTPKWINDNTVEVSGGYYEDVKSASTNQYRVVRKGGKWVVENDKLTSIS